MNRRRGLALLLVSLLTVGLPLFVFGWRATVEREGEITRGRVALAGLAAQQADHILEEAFLELELLTAPLSSSVMAESRCLAGDGLSERLPRSANFSRAVFVLGCDGDVIAAAGPAAGSAALEEQMAALFLAAGRAVDRYASRSFISAISGHATGVLALPLYDERGDRVGTVVGLMDLEQHFSEELADTVSALGETGHADIIGADGSVLASTRHELSATAGRHPGFYGAAAQSRAPAVQRVRYDEPDAAGGGGGDGGAWHLMAYSPLHSAPWGVALGSSEAETLAGVRRQRFLLLGLAAAALLSTAAAAWLAFSGWADRSS